MKKKSKNINKKLANLSKIVDAQMKDLEKNKDKIELERLDMAKNNPSCLSFWYPIISTLPGINTPKTKLFPIHFKDQLTLIDQEPTKESLQVIEQMKEFSKELGYPVFMKNSLFSGKHSWKNTCFVSSPDQFLPHLRHLTDFAYAVGCEESLYWIVREIIPTKAPFTAFNEMPVTKERRYFVKDGKVVFHHPYWIPSSIQDPSIENWAEELEKLNHESPEEIKELVSLSETVAKALPGFWSVDFLQDVNGKWYLIDMALGNKSFCWRDYPLGTTGLSLD